jgi:hypothetical protein
MQLKRSDVGDSRVACLSECTQEEQHILLLQRTISCIRMTKRHEQWQLCPCWQVKQVHAKGHRPHASLSTQLRAMLLGSKLLYCYVVHHVVSDTDWLHTRH